MRKASSERDVESMLELMGPHLNNHQISALCLYLADWNEGQANKIILEKV